MKITACTPQRLFLWVVLLAAGIPAYSQAIRYSRQTLPLPVYDKMQLVPDVAGNHHLLFFKRTKPIYLYNYDRDLVPVSKTELPVTYMDSSDLRIIAFRDFYLLYLHKPGSTRHQLWKINAGGEAFSLSVPFQRFIDTTFKQKTSTLELINKEEQLVVVSHTYYSELKAVSTTIVKLDEYFKTVAASNVSYPFERRTNWLHQVMLVGNNVYILKAARLPQEYALEVLRADLTTGKLFRKTFNSDYNFTRDAAFRYSAADSSILVQSTVGAQVFISKLDLSLQEVVSPTLFASPFKSAMATHFLLLGGAVQQWLAISALNSRSRTRPVSGVYTEPSPGPAGGNRGQYRGSDVSSNLERDIQLYRNTVTGFGSYAGYYAERAAYAGNSRTPPVTNESIPVGFAVTDKDGNIVRDSVVSNKKSQTILSASQYTSLMVGTKSYLIVAQELPKERKGLLMVSVDSSYQMTTHDISVFDRYDYILQQAQPIRNGTLVIPYLFKSEVGLVRLAFKDER